MKLQFKVYEGATTMEDLGTVAQAIGKKGTLALIPKNIKKEIKANGEYNRLAVVLENAEGESLVISCSEEVSKTVRKALAGGFTKAQALKGISELSILAGESEIPFICAPSTGEGGLEKFTVAELAKEKTVAGYNALLAF